MRRNSIGSYNCRGAFELRDDGGLHHVVEPDSTFRVGSSIGGYWAKPVQYGGRRMISLIRLSGGQLSWPLGRIRRVLGRERGELLWEGEGLWAASAGSARRGVWHRISRDGDPLRQALRGLGLPSDLVHCVDEIDGTAYLGGQFDRRMADLSWFLADGEELGREAISDRTEKVRVVGGTFLIRGKDWDREDCRFSRPIVTGVTVTPVTDRAAVAARIAATAATRSGVRTESTPLKRGDGWGPIPDLRGW